MSNLTAKTITTATALALLGLQLAACGAAPDGSEEATGTTSQAVCKNWPAPCVEPPPPPPPKLPNYVCTPMGNALTMAGDRCLKAWNQSSDPKSPDMCIGTTTTDPLGYDNSTLAYYERMLMWKYKCSAPIKWEAWNPGYQTAFYLPSDTTHHPMDQADAVMMLCPIGDGSAETYVNSLGILPNADHASRASAAFCDGNIITPPSGYFWAVPWVDPTCMFTGCMTSAPQ